jgi:hypothetical protein
MDAWLAENVDEQQRILFHQLPKIIKQSTAVILQYCTAFESSSLGSR